MDAFEGTRLLIVAPNVFFVRLFLAEQIRLLAKSEFAVQVVCATTAGATDDLGDLPCAVTFVEIVRSVSIVEDLAALASLVSLMRQARPSIVHGHGPKAGLLAAMAAKLCGVPVRLHTIHGLRSDGLQGGRRLLVRSMERLTFACSTKCFPVSHSLADYVVEQKLAVGEKVAVLHHGSWAGIRLQHFNRLHHKAKADALRQKSRFGEDAIVVTYLGRLAHDKGLNTLEAGWQTIRETHSQARLLIAGPPDATDPVQASTMKRLRDDSRVVLLEGFQDDVATVLAATDIFVQPSLREGLGVAALEAAAMELPVIASRVTGLTDTVKDRTSGLLVPPQDAPTLAKAIGYLIDHPEIRAEFGLNGRQLVQERFAQADVLNAGMRMYTEFAMETNKTCGWYTEGKRVFDLAASLAILVIAAPVMLLVALSIWIFLSRPVLFTQLRAGLHGRPIKVFKFRTMRSPRPGEAMIGTDEQRVHWLGSLLRKLSLDELPQLFNVVRGDMSLVGPRPLLLAYLARYSDQQKHRHDALPGITGWAQVNGRNDLSWERRFELDLWYVENRSALFDLKVLLLTLRRVIFPQGVNPTGQTSMPEFLGNPTKTAR